MSRVRRQVKSPNIKSPLSPLHPRNNGFFKNSIKPTEYNNTLIVDRLIKNQQKLSLSITKDQHKDMNSSPYNQSQQKLSLSITKDQHKDMNSSPYNQDLKKDYNPYFFPPTTFGNDVENPNQKLHVKTKISATLKTLNLILFIREALVIMVAIFFVYTLNISECADQLHDWSLRSNFDTEQYTNYGQNV